MYEEGRTAQIERKLRQELQDLLNFIKSLIRSGILVELIQFRIQSYQGQNIYLYIGQGNVINMSLLRSFLRFIFFLLLLTFRSYGAFCFLI